MGTRLFQVGFELQSLVECNVTGASLPVISNTKAHSGSWSARFTSVTNAIGRSIPATAELRSAAVINHNGLGGTSLTFQGGLLGLVAASAVGFYVDYKGSTGLLRLMKDSAILASTAWAGAGMAATDVWHPISLAFKANATTGYFKFYIGSLEVLSFEGDTGSSGITAVTVAGTTFTTSGNGWANFLYADDFYCDATPGEGALPASIRRFFWGIANGNGSASQWNGSDGNQVDNYQQVDDAAAHDGDTTYNKALSSGLQDFYTHATVTLPTDWAPRAYIPTAVARKTDAGVDSEIKIGGYKAGAGLGAAQDLPTSYDILFERLTALPDASTLNEANINLTQIGFESSGVFS